MKKGNIYPLARSRWSCGLEVGLTQGPPTYVVVTGCLGVYLHFGDDPPPIPVVILPGSFSIGRWSYFPDLGGCGWEGTWDNGYDTGRWLLGQQVRNETDTLSSFGMVIGEWGDTRFIELWNDMDFCSGAWVRGFNGTRQLNYIREIAFPWVALGFMGLTYLTYAELRLRGIDPDNTAPESWDSTAG